MSRAIAARLLLRLATALLVLLLVVSATFVALHALPGSPGGLLLDPRVPPATRQQLVHLWGLDRPLAEQYGRWLLGAVRWDWGTSIVYQQPAAAVLRAALPYTLLLGAAALLVEVAVALPLGVLAARRRGGVADHLLRVGSLLLYAVPPFWFALMALLLLAYRWPLFPAGHAAAAAGTGELSRHVLLPALVLGLSGAGGLLRLVRGSFLAALPAEPLRAAEARGLSPARVVWIHGLRRAAAPLLQAFGLSLPALLGGVLVVEVVFSWPGLGRLAFQAVGTRDLPLVLACTVWSGGLVVLGSLLADLLTALADPRLRDGSLESGIG